ncbi:MAG: YcgL domain-containing protein [gamma proteobacterium symbiont of Bathyaustriella thionipta]|nr:YcgL domain-containing protein [gamma proteobacterium symbiont of Bathyaustriella thionipta]
MYLYLAAEDAFDSAPQELMQTFGKPVFVMQLLLDSNKPLAREDIQTVLQNLAENGWHLQMPPHTHPDSCQHA